MQQETAAAYNAMSYLHSKNNKDSLEEAGRGDMKKKRGVFCMRGTGQIRSCCHH